VLRREAVASRVLADVGEPKRFGVADQLSKDAGATRQLTDGAPCRLVDAGGQEALEFLPLLVENADGRVDGR